MQQPARGLLRCMRRRCCRHRLLLPCAACCLLPWPPATCRLPPAARRIQSCHSSGRCTSPQKRARPVGACTTAKAKGRSNRSSTSSLWGGSWGVGRLAVRPGPGAVQSAGLWQRAALPQTTSSSGSAPWGQHGAHEHYRRGGRHFRAFFIHLREARAKKESSGSRWVTHAGGGRRRATSSSSTPAAAAASVPASSTCGPRRGSSAAAQAPGCPAARPTPSLPCKPNQKTALALAATLCSTSDTTRSASGRPASSAAICRHMRAEQGKAGWGGWR